MTDLGDLRREYTEEVLRDDTMAPDPFVQFQGWFAAATERGLLEPNAMILATADPSGQPSTRAVLLKAWDRRGFVFFTNLASRKAQEISANPKVGLLFPWFGLERQLTIRGMASPLSTKEVAQYFVRRPRGSQLGAWVSRQSKVVPNRAILDANFRKLKKRFEGGEIPVPDFWGGYRVAPTEFEFWQGGPHRLHDRIRYTFRDEQWVLERLAP